MLDFDLKLVVDSYREKRNAFNGRMLKCIVCLDDLRCSFLSKKSAPTVVETMQAHLLILLDILYAVLESLLSIKRGPFAKPVSLVHVATLRGLGRELKAASAKDMRL